MSREKFDNIIENLIKVNEIMRRELYASQATQLYKKRTKLRLLRGNENETRDAYPPTSPKNRDRKKI